MIDNSRPPMRCVFRGQSGHRYVVQEAGCNRHVWPVEILRWPPDKDAGFVIAAWRRSQDKDYSWPELHSIGGRLVEYLQDFDAVTALQLGERLARVLVEMENCERESARQ